MVEQQTGGNFRVRHIESIAQADRGQWNRLAGTAYPFLRHEFLSALEASQCTDINTGWKVCHLLLEDSEGRLAGFMPLYSKTNSFGEYVFDWSWADAYHRHGMDYYPKLLTAIPFTPCAGPRLVLAGSVDPRQARALILGAVMARAAAEDASSWHLLFPDDEQKSLFIGTQRPLANVGGLHLRTGCQYQWFNRNYGGFEDFLATLNSRKRKNLRKERRHVEEQGIRFRVLEGHEVTAAQWRRFYRFYQNTYLIRGRSPYLNLEFFTALAAGMPEQLLLVLAESGGNCVAGALFFKGEDTLYGRYWGSNEDYRFLHFETCYYQGIDYCIAHGLQRFDSGAQGEHKIQRGFEPVFTWSLHWIRHPDFAAAIERFVREEAAHVSHYAGHAAEYLPFRKDLQLLKSKGQFS